MLILPCPALERAQGERGRWESKEGGRREGGKLGKEKEGMNGKRRAESRSPSPVVCSVLSGPIVSVARERARGMTRQTPQTALTFQSCAARRSSVERAWARAGLKPIQSIV